MSKKPKVLLYDIETSPNIAHIWAMYEQNALNFVKEWEIMSFAYKYLGEKKVHCFTRDSFRGQSEKLLIKKLYEVLDSADIVISHNGLKFDNKKSNAKFLQYDLLPPAPSQQIDTLRVLRANFALNSNKLEDACRLLGIGEKFKHPGLSLWLQCMEGNREAFSIMADYNKRDVVMLEKLYLKVRPWIKNHPNVSQISGNIEACPACESTKLLSDGLRYTKTGAYRRLCCRDCGTRSRGTVNVVTNKQKVVAL